jgi:hypothetical protein
MTAFTVESTRALAAGERRSVAWSVAAGQATRRIAAATARDRAFPAGESGFMGLLDRSDGEKAETTVRSYPIAFES